MWLTPEEAEKLPNGAAVLEVVLKPGGKLSVSTEIDEQEFKQDFDKLPALLTTPYGTFSFTPGDSAIVEKEQEITVTVAAPRIMANGYANALSVEQTSKTTTIAQISLENTSPQRGVDFINKLIEIYNRDANDDKNEVASKTAEFIDERIKIINGELGTTEKELETFKRDAGLTDLKSDAQLALSENSEYEKKRAENSTQLRLVQFLSEYANNPRPCLRGIAGQRGSDRHRPDRTHQPLQRNAAGAQTPPPHLIGKQPRGGEPGRQHPCHAQQRADHHPECAERIDDYQSRP